MKKLVYDGHSTATLPAFFKYIAANFSLTYFPACAELRYCAYLIPRFSFASANTLSIFSFLLRYSSLYFGVGRISSASSISSCLMGRSTTFSQRFDPVRYYRVSRPSQRYPSVLVLSLAIPSCCCIIQCMGLPTDEAVIAGSSTYFRHSRPPFLSKFRLPMDLPVPVSLL